MEYKKNRKLAKRNIVLVFFAILLAGTLGFLVYKVQKDADNEIIEKAGTSENADHSSEYISYHGNNYPVIRNMTSVLLIGTDNYINDDKQFDREMYYNRNLADFLVVLVFDHDRKKITPFQINRDTMCEVSWLGLNLAVGGYKVEHITYAHMYGTGKEDSCENVVRTARRFLYNAPIDHYLAFTMDAVPIVNDLVGGVTVTLEDDIPALGEEYKAGSAITLYGKAALRFVRYRDTMLLDSNLPRMQHQQLYLNSFTEAARTAAAKNEDLVIDVFKAVDRFLCTDLTVNDISEIVSNLIEYQIEPVISPEGKYIRGNEFAEFYVDEESLWSCIQAAFCR